MTLTLRRSQIEAELEAVVDPCSCLTPSPVSILDLGLVREIEVADGAITITLCMTDPMCMYFVDIAGEIETRIAALGWTGTVSVNWDTAADWDPELMRPAARRARLEARLRLRDLMPHAVAKR
jgi:metal-sulfur cluster biosynthetic enzyme